MFRKRKKIEDNNNNDINNNYEHDFNIDINDLLTFLMKNVSLFGRMMKLFFNNEDVNFI